MDAVHTLDGALVLMNRMLYLHRDTRTLFHISTQAQINSIKCSISIKVRIEHSDEADQFKWFKHKNTLEIHLHLLSTVPV